ncbi:beta protein [Berrimah virus]|uniref:Beta protein n=1 Tax=Berrimah virus TaxID=318834 RepID=I3NUY1_9RHAB|nr:beta protein [Berrimah virus]AEH58023.1 beta protein [Berrimah virus]
MDFIRCHVAIQIINFRALEIDKRSLLEILVIKSIKNLHRSNQVLTRLSDLMIPSAIHNGEFVMRNDKSNKLWIFVGESWASLDFEDLSGVRERISSINKTVPLLIQGEEYGAIDISMNIEVRGIRFLKRPNEMDICDIPRKLRVISA